MLNAAQHSYYVVDGVFYFESAVVQGPQRLVVPTHLR